MELAAAPKKRPLVLIGVLTGFGRKNKDVIRKAWMAADGWFAVTITVLQCVTDSLHLWNTWLQFKMSWWWRSCRHHNDGSVARSVVARIVPGAKKSFFFDLFIILPIPQEL